MTDEEKKDLIKKLGYCEQEYEQNGYLSIGKFNAIKQAIEVIEKQQKEIEELKEKNKLLQENYSSAHEDINWFCENYISKDKIKAKIEPVLKQLERNMEEEYKKYGNSREYQDTVDVYNFLQSLLEKE